jgi:hypothetical protein
MLDLPTPLPCTVYFEFKATISFANRGSLKRSKCYSRNYDDVCDVKLLVGPIGG